MNPTINKKRIIITIAGVILLPLLVFLLFPMIKKNTGQPTDQQERIQSLYQQNCAGCHGAEGLGTVRGVRLAGRNFHPDYIKSTIRQGSTRMPKFNIPEPYLTDLAVYVGRLQ